MVLPLILAGAALIVAGSASVWKATNVSGEIVKYIDSHPRPELNAEDYKMSGANIDKMREQFNIDVANDEMRKVQLDILGKMQGRIEGEKPLVAELVLKRNMDVATAVSHARTMVGHPQESAASALQQGLKGQTAMHSEAIAQSGEQASNEQNQMIANAANLASQGRATEAQQKAAFMQMGLSADQAELQARQNKDRLSLERWSDELNNVVAEKSAKASAWANIGMGAVQGGMKLVSYGIGGAAGSKAPNAMEQKYGPAKAEMSIGKSIDASSLTPTWDKPSVGPATMNTPISMPLVSFTPEMSWNRNRLSSTPTGPILRGPESSIYAADNGISDINAKTNITSADKKLDNLMAGLKGYEFEYKDTANGVGKRIGPMAQNIEKSEIGKNLVINDSNNMKMVNFGKMMEILPSAIKRLNDRADKIEKKK